MFWLVPKAVCFDSKIIVFILFSRIDTILGRCLLAVECVLGTQIPDFAYVPALFSTAGSDSALTAGSV